MLTKERLAELNEAMQHVNPDWRYRWCENKICGCMGGANCSGRLSPRFTKDEWKEWVELNPPKEKGAESFVINGRYDITAHLASKQKIAEEQLSETLCDFLPVKKNS